MSLQVNFLALNLTHSVSSPCLPFVPHTFFVPQQQHHINMSSPTQTTKNDSAVEAAGTAAATATATTVATATTTATAATTVATATTTTTAATTVATPAATPVGTTAAVAQGEPDGAELENVALGGMLQAQRDEEDICQGKPCKHAWMCENALINQALRTNNDYKMHE
jgi:hypothetical protein